MPFAYRRENGQIRKRDADIPGPQELVVHTGKQPRRRLSKRAVQLGPDNKPIRLLTLATTLAGTTTTRGPRPSTAMAELTALLKRDEGLAAHMEKILNRKNDT